MKNEFQLMSQNSFLSFCLGQNPEFKIGKHHRKIAKILEKVECGEIKRLIINMPPRHSKSYTCNYMFPLWLLGKHPEKNIISISYSQELAQDFGRKIRNQMNTEEYQRAFPGIVLAEDSKSAAKFSTNKGGDYFALGAGGSITGRGADLIIMDDLIKNHQEARSKTSRDFLREWYSSTLRTRLMPNGAIVLIMTRWSIDDIAGWLMEKDLGEWEVVSLPAIDEDNNPLWPEQFTLDELESIKREVGSAVFNSLYQQNPAPDEGVIIKKEWLRFYEVRPDINEIVISWDTTFKDTDSSDYCVGCVIGRSKGNEKIYLLEVIRNRMDFNKARATMKLLSTKYSGAITLVEESANGHALIQSLKNEIPNLVGVKVTDSKESRIMAIAPVIEAGQILFPNPETDSVIDECLNELVTFPKGKHDDFCDSLAQGIIRLKNDGGYRWFSELLSMSEEELLYLQNGPSYPETLEEMLWPNHFGPGEGRMKL